MLPMLREWNLDEKISDNLIRCEGGPLDAARTHLYMQPSFGVTNHRAAWLD